MILYIIIGILGGIIGGMGMGGGTLLIPMLTLICNIQQVTAQKINLVCFLPMAIASLIFHIKNKLVVFKKSYLIMISGVVFSCLVSFIAVKTNSKKLKIYFAIFLIVLGIIQLISLFIEKKQSKKTDN